METFIESLKQGLLGAGSKEKWIWLGNVEVEQHWRDETLLALPGSGMSNSQTLVNNMGEMALFLAEPCDIVCLKESCDKDYLEYVKQFRGTLPDIVVCSDASPDKNITQSFLQNKKMISKFINVSTNNYFFLPYGTSFLEELLAKETNISLATPSSKVCIQVNSKIYSRKLAEKHRIRQAVGVTANTLDELEKGFESIKHHLAESKLVLKDAYGGLW